MKGEGIHHPTCSILCPEAKHFRICSVRLLTKVIMPESKEVNGNCDTRRHREAKISRGMMLNMS